MHIHPPLMPASTATPIIFLDAWVKLTSTTIGRDKVIRLVQYFSRFLAYHLAKSGHKKDVVQNCAKLSLLLGTSRKCKSFAYKK
jgi:Peroxisomal biogenesis factor 11 (PEX11)